MNITWIERVGDNRSAVVLFAGWGMDGQPFSHYSFPHRDFAVVWDYATEGDIRGELSDYDEICVVAWSFGVANAARFIESNSDLPITLRVAINGTLRPVDAEFGIHPDIYRATLDGFCETGLAKFNRRMCGSRSALSEFEAHRPLRTLESLEKELFIMGEFDSSGLITDNWDSVYVSDSDMIIPTENQIRAWKGHHNVHRIDGAHLVDIHKLMIGELVDKVLLASRFQKATDTYDRCATVQRDVAERLITLLPAPRCYENILEIGAGTGVLTSMLVEKTEMTGEIRLWDLVAQQSGVEVCDAEVAIRKEPPCQFDLIVSSSAVQWFQSPFAFVREAFRLLKDGGILALSTFSPGTYSELSQVTGHGISYPHSNLWRERLESAGFKDIVIEESVVRLHFPNASEVLRHIHHTGVNGLTDGVEATSKALDLIRRYPVDTVTGDCTLTYRPLWIIARRSGMAKE